MSSLLEILQSISLIGILTISPPSSTCTGLFIALKISAEMKTSIQDGQAAHDGERLRAGAAEGSPVLGRGRHEHGALLRPQVLPRAGRLSEREGRRPGRQEARHGTGRGGGLRQHQVRPVACLGLEHHRQTLYYSHEN